MASFRGAHKSYVQRLLEVTWDVHGAMLLLIVPCARSCQEGEPGEIADPHKTFSDEPWPGTLGLAGKSPLAEHAVGSYLWLEMVVLGGLPVPPPLWHSGCHLVRKCIMPQC